MKGELPWDEGSDLALRWSGRVSLTRRILAINILALLLLAGGFFYLDSFRSRILDSRVAQATREAQLIAEGLGAVSPELRDALVVRFARDTGSRIRLYAPDGAAILDSRALGQRNFQLNDPDKDDWGQKAARFLDAGIDTIVAAPRAPLYRERADGRAWPDVRIARATRGARATVGRAPDRTSIITASAPLDAGAVVLIAIDARDITQRVRVERFRLSMVLLIVTIVSVFLSLFLARTIVRPLRRLARAAVRVRLGRAREVVVPRLPERKDEIGMLARALSDMSLALRARIDATEAFAADVAHELKNPLASMASAVESLGRTNDPAIGAQLRAILSDDVRRLDRAITDIAELSRIDAELSRVRLEPVDIEHLLDAMVEARSARQVAGEPVVRLTIGDIADGDTRRALADETRLPRAIDNLIDNALSFSPPGGEVRLECRREGSDVVVTIDDDGPGVAPDQRETIFMRFQSNRPDLDDPAHAGHSGLGLAIARAIIEGIGGTVHVEDAPGGGARFVVRLPLAGHAPR